MKPTLLAILLFACQFLHAQTEEDAIKAVVYAETEAFSKKSVADMAKEFWILDEKTIMMVTLVDGTTLQMTTSDILEQTSVPPESHATFVKSNFRIQVLGAMAYVAYDQVVTLSAEEGGGKVLSHEIHVMEKVAGVWKIHASAVLQYK
jgi:hypothetical protein